MSDHDLPSIEPESDESDEPRRGRRTQVLPQIRVSPGELAAINSAAQASGRKRSDFVRRCALGRRLPPVMPQPSTEALAQLRGVANNLNQLTRHLHTSQATVGRSELEQVRAELAAVARVVSDLGASLLEPLPAAPSTESEAPVAESEALVTDGDASNP